MDNILGYNLRKYREKNNLTQKEFAAQLGISRTALTGYENGKNYPTSIILISMAKGMNCSIDDLLGYKCSSPISLSYTEDIANLKEKALYIDELTKKIIRTYNELNLSKKRVNRMLKELTMSNKRNNLTHDELTRTINRLIKTQDLFKEATESFFNSIEVEPESTVNLYSTNDIDTNINNEITATLEKDNIAPEDSSDDYFDYDNYLSYNFNDSDEYTKLPLLGEVAAGNPREAIEIVDDYYSIPSDRLSPNHEYFLLRVKGDSMNKLYDDGDILLVQQQGFFDNGTLVIALIDTDDPIDRYNATFKRYYKYDDIIELHPESTNPIHKVQKYSAKNTIILGAVLGSLREYVE